MTTRKAISSKTSTQLKKPIKNNENSIRVIVSCRHRCNGLTSAFNFFVSLFFSKALDRSVKSFSFLNIFANNLAITTISRYPSWLTSKEKMNLALPLPPVREADTVPSILLKVIPDSPDRGRSIDRWIDISDE